MFIKIFNTQKEACLYYGHSWKFLEKKYKISRCYDSTGFRGYFFRKK